MITPPRRRAVLDTDTFNEVDDQFALAHLILSPEEISLEAIYAAPFHNNRSEGPEDGMERSYEEIHRVLELVPPPHPIPVFRGSTSFLADAATPVASEAVDDLISRALAMKNGEKLLVIAIAVATNVASALLKEPRIAEHIEIVWLGGHAPYWPNTREFNLEQDIHASRILLDTEVSLVLIPCQPVTSHLITTPAELEKHIAGHSRLGTYLTDIVRIYTRNTPAGSKNIWDIAAAAWAIDPTFLPLVECPSPALRDDLTWERLAPAGRRNIRIATEVDRDRVFADFFRKACLAPA